MQTANFQEGKKCWVCDEQNVIGLQCAIRWGSESEDTAVHTNFRPSNQVEEAVRMGAFLSSSPGVNMISGVLRILIGF